MPLLALLLGPTPEGYGTGLEWMPVVSFLVPLFLLAAIWFFGSRNTV